MLTKRQLQLFKFLQQFKKENEVMPTFTEMMEHMNVNWKWFLKIIH